jgi:riboflavin biosynthesis pyrimidine reductase
MRGLGVALGVGLALLASASARAQIQSINPGVIQNDIDRQRQQLEQQSAPPKLQGPAVIGGEREKPGILKPGGPKFRLRKIEFDSSKFITPEELDEIAKKYIGQDADISTLQQVVADINAIYAERGIVTGIATLPEQDAKEVRMKPHVICLMASSVDGRTLPSRWRPKGSAGNLFERVHDELAGDAWLVGRVTGQEFAKGKPYPASTSESFPREHWFARRDAQAYGVVLDAQGKIGWARSDIGGDPVLVVLSEKVSDAHLAGLRGDGVSYIFAGGSELDLALTLDILNRELGVKRLLLEGGGGANGAFLRAGLVDELHLIVCPAIDGAKGAPSVFDSTEAEAAQRAPVMAMTLESSQTLEGRAMLLRYRIQNEAPEAPASR